MSSLAQYRGLPSAAAYCASKAFLSHFSEALRVDLDSTGVAVTDVRPGFVRTPMTADSKLTMPFLIDLDQAITEITEGIRTRAAIVAFPWQLASLVRAGTFVPVRVYDSAVRRIRKNKRAAR